MSRARASLVGPLTWVTVLVLSGLLGAGMMAFLRTPVEKLPPESVHGSIPDRWVLPPGRVVILVPEGKQVPASWPFARPIRERQLRDYGFVLARTASELEQVVQDGAQVIWIHRDAVRWVAPDWVRARHGEGHPVGVIDGTIEDLRDWYGIGPGVGGWLRQGGVLPTFALFDGRSCRIGPSGRSIEPPDPWRYLGGATSEHFSLGLVVDASQRAVTFCS